MSSPFGILISTSQLLISLNIIFWYQQLDILVVLFCPSLGRRNGTIIIFLISIIQTELLISIQFELLIQRLFFCVRPSNESCYDVMPLPLAFSWYQLFKLNCWDQFSLNCWFRDYFLCALIQWELLQCNAVSHWLGAYKKKIPHPYWYQEMDCCYQQFRLLNCWYQQLLIQRSFCVCPDNEKQRYNVTLSPIGWTHTQKDPSLLLISGNGLLLATIHFILLIWYQQFKLNCWYQQLLIQRSFCVPSQ